MSEEIVAIPLLQPSAGTPEIIETEEAFRAALKVRVPLQLMQNGHLALGTAHGHT